MPATRKLYEEIAEGFRMNRPNESWANKRQQWEADVAHVADSLKQDNGAFKKERFVEWCNR